MEELHTSGEIVSGTTWKSIYPLLEGDDRYQNLLGTPGSSPLDLFWDVIDELDCKAEEDQRMVESVLESRKVPVGEETSYDDFAAAVAADERLAGLDFAVIRNVYDKASGSVFPLPFRARSLTFIPGPCQSRKASEGGSATR